MKIQGQVFKVISSLNPLHSNVDQEAIEKRLTMTGIHGDYYVDAESHGIVCDAIICDEALCDYICDRICGNVCDQICDKITNVNEM